MSGLGWGVPRPTNRPGKPGTAAANVLREKRMAQRIAGMDPNLADALSSGPTWAGPFTKTYADFSAAATTKTITVFALPAKAFLNKLLLLLNTPFLGGAIASYTVTPVTIADILTYDAFGHAAGQFTFANESFTLTMGQPYEMTATRNVELRADSTGANLSAATQGSLTLWLEYSVPPSS